jgi:hypothetical protein
MILLKKRSERKMMKMGTQKTHRVRLWQVKREKARSVRSRRFNK